MSHDWILWCSFTVNCVHKLCLYPGRNAVVISLMPVHWYFRAPWSRNPTCLCHCPDCSINTSCRSVPRGQVAFLCPSSSFSREHWLSAPFYTFLSVPSLPSSIIKRWFYLLMKSLYSACTVFLAPWWCGWLARSCHRTHLQMVSLNSSGTCDICPEEFVKHMNQSWTLCLRDGRNWQSKGVCQSFSFFNSHNIKSTI